MIKKDLGGGYEVSLEPSGGAYPVRTILLHEGKMIAQGLHRSYEAGAKWARKCVDDHLKARKILER